MADNADRDRKDKIRTLRKQVQRNGWRIEEELISTVGIGLIVRPPEGSWENRDTWRNLRNLLGIIRDISIQADFLCPIVAGLPDIKQEERELLYRWQRDQDWHRGNFILFPYEKEDDDNREIEAILHPEKVDLGRYTPELVTTGKIIKGMEENEDVEEGLKDLIIQELKDIYTYDTNEWERYWEIKIGGWIGDETNSVGWLNKAEGQKEPDNNSIGKITSIRVENFKGIKKIELDVSADIVLITGPNGNGKSSFIEALTLALTGFHPEAVDKKIPDHFFHYGAEEFTVEIKVEHGKPIILKAARGEERPNIDNELEIKRKQIGAKQYYEKGSGKLLFRLTSLLPEHVRLLFDEEVTGQEERKDEISPANVLSELFEPLPMEVRTLYKTIQKILKEIKTNIEEIEEKGLDMQKKAEYLDKNPDRIEELVKTINPLLQALDIKEAELSPIEGKDTIKRQGSLLDDLRQQLEQRLSTEIDFSKRSMDDAYEEINEKIEDKYGKIDLEELYEERNRLLKEREKIEEMLKEYNEYMEKLRSIFDSLADKSFLSRCIDILRGEAGFNDIAEEIRLVDPDKAERFRGVIKSKGLPFKGKDQIDKELEEINEKIENARKFLPYQEQLKKFKKFVDENYKILDTASSFLDLYKDNKSDEEYLSRLEEKQEQLEGLRSFLENQQELSKGFIKTFEEAINKVLKRFAMTRGLDSVVIDRKDKDREGPGYRIHAKEDGQCPEEDNRRSLQCFSLGQRAQIGLAWMVASRELAENSDDIVFPHRAIVLDDPTATFDMTNLLGHVLLCRQLAYHPEPDKRYQLFIVSHHEEFTDRLLDLLCPPGKACSMRLLRFTDWTPRDGAKIECFKVEPAPGDMEKATLAFEKGLDYLRSDNGSPS